MKTLIKKTVMGMALALSMASLTSLSFAALPADFDAKMAARPDADKMRDDARKPKETIALLGLQEGQTVIDVAAGGGWFTRVLSAGVGPKGKVIAQFGAFGLRNNNGQAQKDMAAELGNVEPLFTGMETIAPNSADAAITALNLHDMYNNGGEEGGVNFIKGMFNALKPGGTAVIIDHEGNEGVDNKPLHRIPAATVKALIAKAGFEVVSESKLLDNPKDDHTKPSSSPDLERHTDQVLFVARKPK